MYRFYIDETGNADLDASRDPNHRYLSLTGIILHQNHVRKVLTPRLNALKDEIFDPDPDDPIILHRKDILQRNRPFHLLRNAKTAMRFDDGLLSILNDCDYTVITAVIDKLEHLERYTIWQHDPYHYCLEVLLERYVLWLRSCGGRGDVMGEVRGGKPDRRLEKSFTRFYDRGNTFIRSSIVQARLTSRRLKLKPKDKNISGLQLADIMAHPSAVHVRSQNAKDAMPRGFGKEIVKILNEAKYNRSPRGKIVGWGTKWLP